jgi:hypothetical protein
MLLSGPDPWARPQPLLRWLLPVLLAALAFAFAAPLTPVAGADEALPPAAAADAPPVITDPPPDPLPPEPPTSVEPAPEVQPDPVPVQQPDPVPPAPEPPVSADPPAAPAEETPSTPPDRAGDGGSRSNAPSPSASSSAESVLTTLTGVAPTAIAPALPTEATPAATTPLGWDVYDDVLFSDMTDGNGGAGSFGGDVPPSFGGFSAVGAIGPGVEAHKHENEPPAPRADPLSSGGTGPGGSGPGQGPSLGLAGAGGSGGGIALLTLLGMACGWFLLPRDPMRAFRTSTATWRPSAYVPPIERPG